MNNPESIWGPERGQHIYKTSESAVRMITERINLENLGLQLKVLPLCTEEESIYIEELIPRAKEGFALSFKSEYSRKDQDLDLLSITTPLTRESFNSKISLSDRQNSLPEYWHVLATLKTLTSSGKVSFYQFIDPPSNIDYETGMTETYWSNSTDNFEKVWGIMEELEKLVRASLYSSRPMSTQDILKIGHFFMTSKAISGIFDS